MKSKEVSAADAVALVHDNDVLICSGFGPVGVPDALLEALAASHERTGHPRALTAIWGGGPGDSATKGFNRLAREGLIARAIGGHWGQVPRMSAFDERPMQPGRTPGLTCSTTSRCFTTPSAATIRLAACLP